MRRFLPYITILVVALLLAPALWLLVQGRPTPAPPEESRLFTPVIREAEASVTESEPPAHRQVAKAPGRPQREVAARKKGLEVQPPGHWARIESLLTGYQGDPVSPALVRDGPALAADLCFPTSIALGPSGEIYVAEPHTTLVRVIANGKVSTLRPMVRRGDADQATPLAFERPARLAVHGGQLYVLEDVPDFGLPSTTRTYTRSRVWRVDLRTKQATLVEMPEADNRESRDYSLRYGGSLEYAYAMASDPDRGVLFLLPYREALFRTQAGEASRRYLRLKRQQVWDLLAQEREGPFEVPYLAGWGMTSLPDGRIVLACRGVVAVLEGNGSPRILAGSLSEAGHRDGKGSAARFDQATGIAWDARRQALIVADAGSDTIRAVTLDGVVTTVAGGVSPNLITPYDRQTTKESGFYLPMDVCVAPDGSILVADSGYNLIRKIAPDGKVTIMAGRGRCYIIPVPVHHAFQ